MRSPQVSNCAGGPARDNRNFTRKSCSWPHVISFLAVVDVCTGFTLSRYAQGSPWLWHLESSIPLDAFHDRRQILLGHTLVHSVLEHQTAPPGTPTQEPRVPHPGASPRQYPWFWC